MKAIPFPLAIIYTRTLISLSVITAVSACLYGILLLMTVMHAAARQDAQVQIHALTMQVGVLENQYLQETQNITSNSVAALGLVKPTTISTVYADAGSLSLRVNQ